MTPYLSRTELINFIHFCASTDDFERTLQEQEKKKNVDELDKKYLKALRTSLTWAKKALVIRRDALDKASLAEVESRLSHLDFRLLPNDEMRRELKKLQQDPHAIHMTEDDLADLLLTAVPNTCGNCDGHTAKECPLRRVLVKYGVPCYDSKATTCQYAYPLPDDAIEVKQGKYANAIFGDRDHAVEYL